MLIRAGLSSKEWSPVATAGPVRILAVVGAEKSRSVLAISSKSGSRLRTTVESSDVDVDSPEFGGVFLSPCLDFLRIPSGSLTKLGGRFLLFIHLPCILHKMKNKWKTDKGKPV